MDESEFRQLLELFPVVRSRDYQLELDTSRQLTSSSTKDEEQIKEWQDAQDEENEKHMENHGSDLHDTFWKKLKLAAARKVGAAEADKFCQTFHQIHKKLVYGGLSLDAARSYIKSLKDMEK